MHIVSKTPYAKQGDDWSAYPCAFENLPDFPFKDTAKTLSSVCNVPKDNDKDKKCFLLSVWSIEEKDSPGQAECPI